MKWIWCQLERVFPHHSSPHQRDHTSHTLDSTALRCEPTKCNFAQCVPKFSWEGGGPFFEGLWKINQAMKKIALGWWHCWWCWWSLNDVVTGVHSTWNWQRGRTLSIGFYHPLLLPPLLVLFPTKTKPVLERKGSLKQILGETLYDDDNNQDIDRVHTCQDCIITIVIIVSKITDILINFDMLVKNIDLVTLSDAVGRICEPRL